MGPLEAFLRSIPDQGRQKVYNVGKEKCRHPASPTVSNNIPSLNTGTLWTPPIAPPLSEMADLTLQPSTSAGNLYFKKALWILTRLFQLLLQVLAGLLLF